MAQKVITRQLDKDPDLALYVAERLAAWLRENHEHVSVIHRDLQGDAAEV